jgi:hypothetical protein
LVATPCDAQRRLLDLVHQVARHADRRGIDQAAVERDRPLAVFRGVLHRSEDPLGPFHLGVGWREHLVRQGDLRWVDRPLALAPERGRSPGRGPVALGIGEVAEGTVDRAETLGAARGDHP